MKTVVISGEERKDVGTKFAKQTRKEGQVPCVVYGKEGVSHFTVAPLDVREIVYTAEFKVADLQFGSTSKRAILKDIQFHPVTDQIVHIDFLELYDGHPVKVELPIVFEGEAKGVKAGGRLVSQMRKIPVKAAPEKLVDSLVVNITELEMGDAVRIKEINPVDGIEVMAPANAPIATIQIPRALRSAAAAAAKEGDDSK